MQIGLSSLTWDKWNFLRKPKSKSNSYFRVKKNLHSKRGGKQGELVGTCTSLKCIPKGWLVVAANAGNHDPIRVLYRVVWDLGFAKTQMSFFIL
jgi:hypothetical protein